MNLIRPIVERLARGRIVWRRLKNGRPVALSPDSRLQYLGWSIDPDLDELARTHVRDGANVWDVGANCGTFIFSCDHAAKRVAVEPDPFLCGLIGQSAERNGLAVTCYQAAVGGRSGTARLVIAKRGRSSNHLADVEGSTQADGDRAFLDVRLMTLDELLDAEGRPDFVKIDVEGAELILLRSASRLLATRPTLFIEVFGANAPECRALLTAAGYELREGDNWLATPRND